ncbi:MAG: 50S ribosomal protein L11 [Candidatus Uhrbacteria bacterium]
MPSKKLKAVIKLQIPAGRATPAPPVGPALGQHGVNIQDFCMKFNAATSKRGDEVVPVIISVFEDRTFTFITKTPPASELIKKTLGIPRGSGKPHAEKVGKLTKAQLREIAEKKLPDLNTTNVESAMRIIAGTARQMGVTVEE